MVKAGMPGATCTWTSTGLISIPSNATVVTRWTMSTPAAYPAKYRNFFRTVKNI
jgi:hypothetical protein